MAIGLKFIDLFAGLGGFRVALERLGHDCVFACEVDPQLQEIYTRNFPYGPTIHDDIRVSKKLVPPHDILCAGFPCQPFSKSGTQAGFTDETSGTLFHEILDIVKQHTPSYIILENVGNFERHDKGRTWRIVRNSLRQLGYEIRATEHVASGGEGLLSPHHLDYPHHRERFFAVASLLGVPRNSFPPRNRKAKTSMAKVVQPLDELSERDLEETRIAEQHRQCIEHWNSFLEALPEERFTLPSFPIWADEIDATYPFEHATPWARLLNAANDVAPKNGAAVTLDDFLLLPSYARRRVQRFPPWKVRFIEANRTWLSSIRKELPLDWVEELRLFPPSLRKLEWNCQGESRNLWNHILQFRPSGLRAKRYTNSPSLVAMTSTQIPILGPEQRHLTRREGLRLQGFPDSFHLPESRVATFKALGNAVHVDLVQNIAHRLVRM
ncbi:MAG: DNA cytosine methyltransferase [Acidimicrobiia bacterium]|nr:DNA cytosine methyltransferase [Acidimicrobiia bacterium]